MTGGALLSGSLETMVPRTDQLDTTYAYGTRREDDSFTRLLRAGEFSTAGIPSCQGPEGLMILPASMQHQHAPNPNIPDRMDKAILDMKEIADLFLAKKSMLPACPRSRGHSNFGHGGWAWAGNVEYILGYQHDSQAVATPTCPCQQFWI
ncbi:hypothetical protein DL95DRAFT_103311 [Leptodontidium sp. 2 PMI_412]|nr:hypothetical protein DL95DRAFT_103311 [Leptodontidium sp. 2 PMI_412]